MNVNFDDWRCIRSSLFSSFSVHDDEEIKKNCSRKLADVPPFDTALNIV